MRYQASIKYSLQRYISLSISVYELVRDNDLNADSAKKKYIDDTMNSLDEAEKNFFNDLDNYIDDNK